MTLWAQKLISRRSIVGSSLPLGYQQNRIRESPGSRGTTQYRRKTRKAGIAQPVQHVPDCVLIVVHVADIEQRGSQIELPLRTWTPTELELLVLLSSATHPRRREAASAAGGFECTARYP